MPKKREPIDSALLDENSSHDPHLKILLLNSFLEAVEKGIASMEIEAKSAATRRWYELAHNLKESAFTVGAQKLGLLFLEAYKHLDDLPEGRKKLIEKIKAEFKLVKNFIEKELKK